MINRFKDSSIRDTGVINKGMFEQVKMLYLQDKEKGGELAVSLMELVLTGDYSSDDFMVQFAIANHNVIVQKNQQTYDKRVEAGKQARIEKLQLEKIAEMLAEGRKQTEIAATLNESKQVINNRVSILRTDYPELLDEAKEAFSQKSQKSKENQTYDNDNDNVNDNVNDFSSSPSSKTGGAPQPPKKFEF